MHGYHDCVWETGSYIHPSDIFLKIVSLKSGSNSLDFKLGDPRSDSIVFGFCRIVAAMLPTITVLNKVDVKQAT